MAERSVKISGARRLPSRLQSRAPASIQISAGSDWNVAIPLLSPLVTSPSSPTSHDLTASTKSSSSNNEESRKSHNHNQVTEPEKPVVFKKWQHPAAPFCYEPAPLVPFICTGGVDRSYQLIL